MTVGLPDDRSLDDCIAFPLDNSPDPSPWGELVDLTLAAANRCRRRGETRKARWFTRQATLARERHRGLIHGGSFPQPLRE